MSKKKKKKSLKERQRERQIKQQKAQETYRIRREREAERKPRQWPKGKILMAVCLLVLIFGAYGAWQYTKPSTILEESPPQTPIYIRADGSVEPLTANITSADNVIYTFTGNNYESIVLEMDNIVVDGAGYILQGTGSETGIDLTDRSNVTITNIKIKDFDCGVYLYSASHSVLSQNDLTNNNYGIYLEYSSNNSISGNNITNNSGGITITDYADYNSVSGNNITANNYYGIILGSHASFNSVSGNNITNNEYGIELYESSDNSNYHNNFINNTYQVYDYSWDNSSVPLSTNFWDDGYPSGGNYWSDYEEGYPDAEELDGSGIWNTPYVIDENNQDNYPLMNL